MVSGMPTSPPLSIDFLTHVSTESARFAAVLAETDPSAMVPTCPGWTAADLLWHLAEVQWLWGTIVDGRFTDRAAVGDPPDRPSNYGEVLSLYRDASTALIEALARTNDEVPVWTWFAADRSTGFVRRRQAHEALIHRIDAELTAGLAVTEADSALATDGVAEVLDWMYSAVPRWARHDLDGPVGRIATTDTRAQWLAQIGRFSGTSPKSGKTYTDEPTVTVIASGEPSFAITGAARDLDAWLWNRPTESDVAVEGEDAARFCAIITGGVQ
jgi:uncharacterized protein (TIGR03083 family)